MHARDRIDMTLACRDTDAIPKVPGAGSVTCGPPVSVQLMHNGLKILAGAYHGEWMTKIIGCLHGHHEPQEERIFHDLLRHVRPNSLMIELASFWAYYAMWYLRSVPGSRAICVEPDPNHMAVGRTNAELNQESHRIQFIEAWIGGAYAPRHTAPCESTGVPRELPCFDMGAVDEAADGRSIEILHMDAQGAELAFIRSIGTVGNSRRPRFLMASTHHWSISGLRTTHEDCLRELARLGATVLVEFDAYHSFSGDGLIVAAFEEADRNIRLPLVALNKPSTSLFPHG
jgi:FkbM family methyltransferase